jgi:hypothetical protein
VQEDNFLTRRLIYWYDVDSLNYLLRALWQSDSSILGKLRHSVLQIGTLNQKYINFGLGDDILEYYLTDNFRDARFLGPGENGFYSLEMEMVTGQEDARHIFVERRDELLADPQSISERAESSSVAYDRPATMRRLFRTQIRELERMQALAEEHGVKLYFYLPPRMNDRAYSNLLPVFLSLDPARRMDLGNPEENPEFYSLENSFDLAHLNDKGAEEFTRALARELMTLGQAPGK